MTAPGAHRPTRGHPDAVPAYDEDDSVLSLRATVPQTLRWGEGAGDVADVRPGNGHGPLLVLLHGGFWRPAYDRTHTRPMTQALAEAGWAVAAPEYRREPGDPDATCQDVRHALATLPALVSGHDGRVVVAGHSAGGHLALWAAATCPAPGLVRTVGLGAVADLALAEQLGLGGGAVPAFLGAVAATRPDLDPAMASGSAGSPAPVVLVHGRQDLVVPVSVARSYADRHPSTGLVEVPGAGHFALIDPRSMAWPAVVHALTV
ncbi:MAG: alpha/beta hydrolase [Candidatus Nanopelagicales bacterium]